MLLYQTNPVGVQLFSYVNTFFCHDVVVPNQSCGSSTLLLCKHFIYANKFCMAAGNVMDSSYFGGTRVWGLSAAYRKA